MSLPVDVGKIAWGSKASRYRSGPYGSKNLRSGLCGSNHLRAGEDTFEVVKKLKLDHPRHVYTFGTLLGKRTADTIAKIALSSFNENSLSQQGPEYELVDALACTLYTRWGIYHCNFIARLKNESEAEEMLFFGDVRALSSMICHLCSIIGPKGYVTGEFGCPTCSKHPGLVQHPQGWTYVQPVLTKKFIPAMNAYVHAIEGTDPIVPNFIPNPIVPNFKANPIVPNSKATPTVLNFKV